MRVAEDVLVIDEEQAVRLVQAELEREFTRSRGYWRTEPMVILSVEQHALGWLIIAQSAQYAQTGDLDAMLVGHGPYLVDGQDGRVHQIPVMTYMEGWEGAYRHQVRGETPPAPADEFAEQVRALLAEHGRLAALKHLRHHSGQKITLHQAQEYIDALAGGRAVPMHLAALTPRPHYQPLHLPIIAVDPTPPTDTGLSEAAQKPGAPVMVGSFRELDHGQAHEPSIHQAVRASAQPHQAQLVAYLQAGTVLAAAACLVHDELDPARPAIGGLALLTDGQWMWRSDLHHYLERYHLDLDPRFLDHTREHHWQPAPVTDAQLHAIAEAMTSENAPEDH